MRRHRFPFSPGGLKRRLTESRSRIGQAHVHGAARRLVQEEPERPEPRTFGFPSGQQANAANILAVVDVDLSRKAQPVDPRMMLAARGYLHAFRRVYLDVGRRSLDTTSPSASAENRCSSVSQVLTEIDCPVARSPPAS
jgi:hypothetical protein